MSTAVDYLVKQGVSQHLHLIQHEREKQDDGDKHTENFGNESQRHFLNLRQSLKNADDQADKQRNQQNRRDHFYQRENRFMGGSYSSGVKFSK